MVFIWNFAFNLVCKVLEWSCVEPATAFLKDEGFTVKTK